MNDAQQSMPNRPRISRAAILAGMGATLISYETQKALHESNIVWPLVVAVFGLAGCAIGVRLCSLPRRDDVGIWPAGISAFLVANAGIAVGVLVQVFLVEELFLKQFRDGLYYQEHNLFPVEIIVFAVLAAVPLALGICGGFFAAARFRHAGPT